jgi:2-polyprenyl-6-methoxyphenol hydroxylase-like FAD-dependent oxidoreductase
MARVLIVGGSLGGLMVANLLHRAGHDVQVLERSAQSLDGRGAGIVTHASLLDTLQACGVVLDDTLGVPVAARVVLDREGEAQCRWDYPQVLTSWGRLYALLRAALPDSLYRSGAPVSSVQQDSEGVAALLPNGEMLLADLLLACDGIRSTVRAQLAPMVQPDYAGYVAWRGVCDEASLSRRTCDTVFEQFGFGLPAREQMIGYPVAGEDNHCEVGRRRWNFVWYRPAAAGDALAALMTDADGHHHADGIPPQQVSWRQIATMRADARALLAPQFAEIVEKTAVPFLQPIFDLVSDRLAFGRIALLGDAAFVARPHVGMGVTKAADDAMALAQALAAHGATPHALQAYEARRLAPSAAVVERGRLLGAYLEASQRGAALRDADEVMRQTAVDPSLFDVHAHTLHPDAQAT